MATGWARRRQAADWVLGSREFGVVRGWPLAEIVFGCVQLVRDAKSRRLGGVSGVGGEGVAEILRSS